MFSLSRRKLFLGNLRRSLKNGFAECGRFFKLKVENFLAEIFCGNTEKAEKGNYFSNINLEYFAIKILFRCEF